MGLFVKTVLYYLHTKRNVGHFPDSSASRARNKKNVHERKITIIKLALLMGITWLYYLYAYLINIQNNDTLQNIGDVIGFANTFEGFYLENNKYINELTTFSRIINVDPLSKKLVSILNGKNNNNHKMVLYNVNSLKRLHIFLNLKDKTDTTTLVDVVYKVNCNNCDKCYVGQTSQNLEKRIKQHQYDIAINKNTTGLSHHSIDTGHKFKFNETQILDVEHNMRKRLISEMLQMKMLISSVTDYNYDYNYNYEYGDDYNPFDKLLYDMGYSYEEIYDNSIHFPRCCFPGNVYDIENKKCVPFRNETPIYKELNVEVNGVWGTLLYCDVVSDRNAANYKYNSRNNENVLHQCCQTEPGCDVNTVENMYNNSIVPNDEKSDYFINSSLPHCAVKCCPQGFQLAVMPKSVEVICIVRELIGKRLKELMFLST
ncbi:giy-yig endonuclease superfamily [Holotrichia oblita]|uniref:Giy-yig endonuclease superfamily n=1 Tax=Holotrichia oblita TaxID=644536 RepID=A0ACB9TKQ9_HOLOL|nr:giy-yig endonuclease superfamily [Holotrichia oblita]